MADELKAKRDIERMEERERAEREASTVWPLSDREKEIIKGLK